MRAGQLKHKITFQQLTVANDTWGHSNETWTDQVTTYASIWPVRGVERMEAMKLDNENTHKIRIRYNSVIHPKMRIEYFDHRKSSTRYFNILAIIDTDERNIYQEIMASEEI
jgi:SPP1 family predicted phage head-tail adaptor